MTPDGDQASFLRRFVVNNAVQVRAAGGRANIAKNTPWGLDGQNGILTDAQTSTSSVRCIKGGLCQRRTTAGEAGFRAGSCGLA